MLAKIIIFIVMLLILVALASGLVGLVKQKDGSKKTVKSLTVRVILSISLFVFLFLAFKFQWIAPHDL